MDGPQKRCVTCRLMRPLSDFNVRSKAADGLQSRCRDCSRAWYVANKPAHDANVQRRNKRVRADYRQRLADYLLDHPCVDCGEPDVRVLDFDHEDPAHKLDEVARLVGNGIAWARVEAEIAKCSVRCANCHRRRTATMRGYGRDIVERKRREALAQRAADRLAHILRPGESPPAQV